jgi:uncharacterized DUF497 family protein
VKFQWDPRKASDNLTKHAASFEEGSTVFGDPLAGTVPDPDHAHEERRFVTIDLSTSQKLLVVVHSDRGDDVRIISVRRATPSEKKRYEAGQNEGS